MAHNNLLVILRIFCVFSWFSCSKDENISTISSDRVCVISTKSAQDITGNSAMVDVYFRSNYGDDGNYNIKSIGVTFDTIPNPDVYRNLLSLDTISNQHSFFLNGLVPNKTYYVRAYFQGIGFGGYGYNTFYGNEIEFQTLEFGFPTVSSGDVNAISSSSASIGGYVSNDGGKAIFSRGFCWGTDPNPTVNSGNKMTIGNGIGAFEGVVSGLSSSVIYYIRAFATNSIGTGYGTVKSFSTSSTSSSCPVVITSAVNSITQTSAIGGGNVTSSGGATVTGRGICYSNTNPNPTISNGTVVNGGSGIGSFSSSLSGLGTGTTYYVRAFATNSAGTCYGSTITFTTTSGVTCPTVTTDNASSISSSSAVSGGNVTSSGGATVTARGICYSSTNLYPTISNGTVVNGGSGIGSFSSSLSGLGTGTTYYVRAFATNSAGTCYGSPISFNTTSVASCPVTVTDINGNNYQTVSIGSQCWMANNLKVTKYNNGDNILTNLSNSSWASTSTGAYSAGSSSCGHLYNWYAINDSRGLCPAGWHAPTDAEWSILENYLGGSSLAGGKMKSISNTWQSPNVGATNESGFNGLPCGQRYDYDGNYAGFGTDGWWYSTTVSYSNRIWCRALSAFSGNLTRVDYQRKTSGLSVRCIKD